MAVSSSVVSQHPGGMGGETPPLEPIDLDNVFMQPIPQMETLKSFKEFIDLFDFDRLFDCLKIGICDKFILWMQKPIYLVYEDKENDRFVFRQASKRGNKQYQKRCFKRLLPVKDALRDLDDSFFVNKQNRWLKTKSLFISLTIDPSHFLWNRKAFWKNIGKYYDNFVRAIISKYGKAFVMRGVIESTKEGYPHIHLIMVFKDQEFDCFRHYNRRKKKTTYRIINPDREKLSEEERERNKTGLEKYWNLGFIDVQAIKNRFQASNYCVKYGIKAYNPEGCREEDREKIELTLSMNWFFRKHSFSFRYLQLLLTDLIKGNLQNSHNTLEDHNLPLGEGWIFLGIVSVGFVKENAISLPVTFLIDRNSEWGEETRSILEGIQY